MTSANGIDPGSDTPLFRQIADLLRDEISTGSLGAGDRLPTESALMATYGASRPTVRRAVELLRTEGLVVTQQGRGAFVRPRPPVRRLSADRLSRRRRQAGQSAFLADTAAQGRRPDVEVLEVGRHDADARVAELLGVAVGSPVLVRRRRYLADGQPMQVATSWLPWDLVEGTPMVNLNPGPGGIYARLEDAGHVLDAFTEDVAARPALDEERRLLRLPSGVPVLIVHRQAHDTSGRVVEACESVHAADRYVLSYRIPAE